MKESNKTTNDKADTILDIIKTINATFHGNWNKNDYVQFINYKWNEENNVFDVFVIPKQSVKHINVNFTLTPTGCTFN